MVRERRDEGFTLIEMMTVVLILGFLVAIAMASYSASTYRARRVTCTSNQRVLNGAIEVYRSDAGRDIDSLDDLAGYVKNYDFATRCPSDGRLLVLDTATQEVSCTYPGH